MEAKVFLPTYTEEDYYKTSENERVELIDGQFFNMASPSRNHQALVGELFYLIKNYIKSNGGPCEVYLAPFAVKLDEDNKTIVEPDISVICDPNKLTDKGCNGAPDWIIEIISPSTAGRDCILKLNKYKSAGVREYWIIDHDNQTVYVNFNDGMEYKLETYSFQDKVKVNIYNDLNIDFSNIEIT